MKRPLLFGLALGGVALGIGSAIYFGMVHQAQPPVFKPVSSPYPTAIYANGIIESEQDSGSNVMIYPEVAGVVARVWVHEGQRVAQDTVLLSLEDSVQRATVAQLQQQAEAAAALLDELRAQPRKEALAIAQAQVAVAESNRAAAADQYDKRRATALLDAQAISRDVLDTAADALRQADQALHLAQQQLALTRAGAWQFDIRNQQHQTDSLRQATRSAQAVLDKYVLRARRDGVVMAINSTAGAYVSPQGAYNAYTAAFDPLIVMSTPQTWLAVRCYVDEILVSRLPDAAHIQAQLAVRGTGLKVPLEFVRVQPYVTPKIELSNQRQEKVDLRVLPVIFRFPGKSLSGAYPGQLVDVFIGPK